MKTVRIDPFVEAAFDYYREHGYDDDLSDFITEGIRKYCHERPRFEVVHSYYLGQRRCVSQAHSSLPKSKWRLTMARKPCLIGSPANLPVIV